MAARSSTNNTHVARTNNLPSNTALTMMGRFFIVGDKSGGYGAFMAAANNQNDFLMAHNTASITFDFYHSPAAGDHYGPNLFLNRWYHIACTSDGSRMRGYLDGVLVVDFAWATWTLDAIIVGNDSTISSEYFDGRIQDYREWGAALSPQEIQREMMSPRMPARRANLNAWLEFKPGAHTVDSTGNSNTWTESGTMGEEPDAPFIVPASAQVVATTGGTTFTQTITATSGSVASIIKQAKKVLSVSSAASVSLAKLVGKILSVSSAGTVSIVKRAGKVLAASSAGTATLNAVKVVLVTLSASAGSAASIVNRANKILSASSSGTVSLIKRANKIMSASSAGTATLSAIKVVLKAISATAGSVASIVRRANTVLSASSSTVATITNRANKLLAASSAAVPALLKQARKTMAAVAGSSASIVSSKLFKVTLSASSAAVASIRANVAKLLVVSSAAQVFLVKRANKILTASSTIVPTLVAVFGVIIPNAARTLYLTVRRRLLQLTQRIRKLGG